MVPLLIHSCAWITRALVPLVILKSLLFSRSRSRLLICQSLLILFSAKVSYRMLQLIILHIVPLLFIVTRKDYFHGKSKQQKTNISIVLALLFRTIIFLVTWRMTHHDIFQKPQGNKFSNQWYSTPLLSMTLYISPHTHTKTLKYKPEICQSTE